MESTETINVAGIVSVCFVIAITMVACDDARDFSGKCASAEAAESGKVPKKELSRDEMLEAEFRQVMCTTYNAVSIKNTMAACRATCKILDEVEKLPSDESLILLDRLMDMVLEASLEPVTNYPSQYKYARPIHIARISWFEKMFYIARQTFYASMRLRNDSFENWDKLFVFFGKFTNEVAMVSSCLPIYNEEKIDYLLNIKGEFKTYVHQVRDIEGLQKKVSVW